MSKSRRKEIVYKLDFTSPEIPAVMSYVASSFDDDEGIPDGNGGLVS
jgi:hypothetical protein